MRIASTLFFALASLAAHAQQTYTPFPMQNAWWQYDTYSGSAGTSFEAYEQLMVLPDEVTMDGKVYHKLALRASSVMNTDNTPVKIPDAIADASDASYGGIRQENKTVYFKNAPGEQEFFLFDFSLGVGDLAPFVSFQYQYTQKHAYIERVEYVTIGGISRACYHLQGGLKVYEGIGGDFGLFQRVNKVKYSVNFSCFSDGNASLQTGSRACEYIWPMGTPASVAGVANPNPVGIYPNPCTDVLHINGPTGAIAEVYDAVGRLVKKTMFTHTINTGEWRDGLYIVKLYSADLTLMKTEKVVKQ